MDEKKYSWKSMGTSFEVSVFDAISSQAFEELSQECQKMSEEFDQKYSRFKTDSLVSNISQQTGVVQVDEDFIAMLQLYFDLYEASEKKLNPLIGFSLSDLGYDANYSFVEKDQVRTTPDLKETVEILADNQISVKEPVLFDFGALGKGYFVDKVSHFLKEKGIKNFLVNGSGDIFCQGEKMRIGLEDPHNEKKAIGIVELQNEAIACSGPHKRQWGSRHHIIDPHSLSSPSGVAALWVKASSVALADALATCLFFVDPIKITKNIKFEYLMLDENYKVTSSSSFNAELFLG